MHSMKQRCKNWDYTRPAIYMITLTQENRKTPLFGEVKFKFDLQPALITSANCDSSGIKAWFSPSNLGKRIFQTWLALSKEHSGFKTLYLQLMEEHLHALLQITQQQEMPLGNIIAGFKHKCELLANDYLPADKKLFAHGFQDSIVRDYDCLSKMFNYLKDNPRRLATKRCFPDLFKIKRHIMLAGESFSCIGNHFLLEYPLIYQIQVSRKTLDLTEKIKELHDAIRNRCTIITPNISQGEKELTRIAIENGTPLILLCHQDFPPLYKPPGKLFDMCANGQLLMLAPASWPYLPGNHTITREKALYLNHLATILRQT